MTTRLELTAALTVLLCASLIARPAGAATVDDDPGIWATFSTSGAFQSSDGPSRWRYWFDAQARYFDLGSGINQWLARPAVGYAIGGGVNGWLGYARFRARNSAGLIVDENRYWQQLDWSAGSWRNGSFSMRVRLEQRSLDIGDDIGHTLRLMTKYVRPIGEGNSKLIVGLEPFIDLNETDWGGDSGINQNRLFLGVGWRLSNKLTIEAGYMNQYIWIEDEGDRVNHLAILNFKLNR